MAAGAASGASRAVLFAGGKRVPGFSMGSSAFLKDAPRGAYTTARTAFGATRVFDFEGHVARLAESSRLMQDAAGVSPTAPERAATDPEWVRESILGSLRPALDDWASVSPSRPDGGEGTVAEAKVSVLVAWDAATQADSSRVPALADACGPASPVGLYVHLQELLPPHSPPIRVLVREGPRANAAAKDTRWVADRAGLEALMGPGSGVEEVLMCGAAAAGAEVYEGTQTNFAALQAGTLRTAGSGVLMGTVRRLLLEVCPLQGVGVREEAPLLRELGLWEGAMLSSTSRLAMPVNEVHVPVGLFMGARGAAAAGREAADEVALAAAEAAAAGSGGEIRLSADGATVVRSWPDPLPAAVVGLRDAVLRADRKSVV